VWVALAPLYAHGLAALGSALSPLLEPSPDTRYLVDGARVLVQRPTWLPKQQRTAPLNWPVWVGAANYGLPLLAALILAAPGWSWRRRGRSLAIGLALLVLSQVAFFVITVVATQQSPVMSPDGMIQPSGHSPIKQPIFYALYYFFDEMGRGFFALLIFLALIMFGRERTKASLARAVPRRISRNAPCPCGSGLKYKRCCGA
jgi:SEC-C motif-containing protein